MNRLTLALATWIGLGTAAVASTAPPREPGALAAEFAGGWESRPKATPEFALTEQTEVLLNGQPCPYAAVPGNARIIRMEVSSDRRTVLRVHFRTGR